MTDYTPIAKTLPQYEDENGLPYVGAVLKAYAAGTSTTIPFALDKNGAVTVATIELNSSGYPEVSGNEVLPFLDQAYKLSLYPNQDAADANTGAIWTIDNVEIVYTTNGGAEIINIGNATARTSALAAGQAQDSQMTYLGTTGGSADAYNATPSIPLEAYAVSQRFIAKISATNLTTTPYFQISGIANPASTAVIKKLSATKTEIATEAGDLASGMYAVFQRNTANDAWILENPEKKPLVKANFLDIPSQTTLTIATGAITINGSNIIVDTEASAASDDLDTINGGIEGRVIILQSANSARDINVTNSGNIITSTGQNFTLLTTSDRLILQYQSSISKWVQVAASRTSVKSYNSGEQTISSSGTLTLAHSLGAIPSIIRAYIICKTTDQAWSVNDTIECFFQTSASADDGIGAMVSLDATNIVVRFGAATFFYNLQNKTTRAGAVIDNTKWKLVVTAFLLT